MGEWEARNVAPLFLILLWLDLPCRGWERYREPDSVIMALRCSLAARSARCQWLRKNQSVSDRRKDGLNRGLCWVLLSSSRSVNNISLMISVMGKEMRVELSFLVNVKLC